MWSLWLEDAGSGEACDISEEKEKDALVEVD